MARWRGSRLRWAVAGLLVVVLVAAVIVAWPLVQLYTGAAPPAQFYEKVELDPALTQDYPQVLGVAHNAGNNLGTLAAALRNGADVVEIDVISARGQLVAGRDHWPSWLAGQLFRGPTLVQAWDHATAASIVKLDLQRTDRGLLDDLVTFLDARAGSRRVMISSRDPAPCCTCTAACPMSRCCSACPGPMRFTSYSRTPRSKRPSVVCRSSRAWSTQTWSPGCTGTSC
jgi:hypothetical protein